MNPFEIKYDYVNNEYSIGKLPESVLNTIIDALQDKKDFEWLAQIMSESQINAKRKRRTLLWTIKL